MVVLLDSVTAPSFFTTRPRREAVGWGEVFEHIKVKMSWEAPNQRFNASLGQLGFHIAALDDEASLAASPCGAEAPVVLMVGLADTSPAKQAAVKRLVAGRSAVVALDCADDYQSLEVFGGSPAAELPSKAPSSALAQWWSSLFDGGKVNKDLAVRDLVRQVWARQSSDDVLFLMLVLINHHFLPFSGEIKTVVSATSSDKTGLKELSCMCQKCSKQMIDCLSDPQCKKALDCLNNCKSNDQVCAYRCITSYESPKFEEFSQCIIQRNNCLGNSASIPMTPDPAPLASFRGQALSFDAADAIFEGHLKARPGETNTLLGAAAVAPASWMVVVGVNPAYDTFSDQHQIFYREKTRRSIMWYDPVFKVETLDGVEVWRRRHYRVRRGAQPGQFRFTVLDNGVLSDEYWRILDCADDLEWAVFYYSGAASAAGTSYTGALVVTRSGAWPTAMADANSETHKRVKAALLRGGIKLWEVYEVRNTLSQPGVNRAGDPPLGIV